MKVNLNVMKAKIGEGLEKVGELGGHALIVLRAAQKYTSTNAFAGMPYFRGAMSIAAIAASIFVMKELIGDYKNLDTKRAKAISVALIVSQFSSWVDFAAAAKLWIAAAIQKGGQLLPAVNMAGTILGVVSIAFQVLFTTLDAISLKSLHTQSKKFKNATSDEAKIETLKTKSERRGARRFFNAIDDEGVSKIKAIFNNLKSQRKSTEKLTEKIQRHFTHLKRMKAISIAIGVLLIVGTVLLMCTPNPAAPVLWGILAVTAGVAIARFTAEFVIRLKFKRHLARELKELTGESNG